MKIMRYLFLTSYVVLIHPLHCGQVQDPEPGYKGDPDVKWNVRKQYDEHGNLLYYDSSCVHTWNHFDFPGPGAINAFRDLDSLFGDFFHFPDGMFEDRTLAFGLFDDFTDSLDLDFSLDSSIFQRPHGFSHYWDFPDFFRMDGLILPACLSWPGCLFRQAQRMDGKVP